MNGINQMTLLGNLGAKPEIKYGGNGTAITNLSVATSESWMDKETNEKKQTTEWHRVSVFGKLAEIVCQYADKGSKVFIQGKLKTRSYEQDGVKKYTTEIVVSGFGGVLQLVDSKGDTQNNNAGAGAGVVSNIDSIPDASGEDLPF